MRGLALVLCVVCVVPACGRDSRAIDAGGPDGAALDARAADAGPDAAERGVRCGPEMTYCDPDTTQGCCVEKGVDPRCEPSGGLCLGDLTSCDGREDCAFGDVCCDYGQGAGCGAAPDCTSDLDGTIVCHGAADCVTATPHCCDGACAATPCP
jgi:hypothetical protein